MKVKGYCFFSKKRNDHLIVIISDESQDGNALLVPLSSVKFDKNGSYSHYGQKCLYYDTSCTIGTDDIIGDDGRHVLNGPTYAYYQLAEIMSVKNIIRHMANSEFEVRCCVSDIVLKKLQEGAKTSDELQERLYEYFTYF